MSTVSEQFAIRDKDLPKPKWVYGDRVFAKFGKIPLVGMVIRESITQEVMIHADLPIIVAGELHHVVTVPRKVVKQLEVIK
jgi:hypothetical protein